MENNKPVRFTFYIDKLMVADFSVDRNKLYSLINDLNRKLGYFCGHMMAITDEHVEFFVDKQFLKDQMFWLQIEKTLNGYCTKVFYSSCLLELRKVTQYQSIMIPFLQSDIFDQCEKHPKNIAKYVYGPSEFASSQYIKLSRTDVEARVATIS